MSLSPQKILQLVDEKLQKEFLKNENLSDELFEDFQKLINQLEPSSNWTELEAKLREIKEMASEVAIERFLDFSINTNITFGKDFDDCTNDVNRSMWVYLYHPDIFREAYLWDRLKDYGSEYKLHRQESLTKDFFTAEKLQKLKTGIQEFFKSERKGLYCEVEQHQNSETGTICISVYFDDYSKSEFGFDGGRLRKRSRKPAKDMHFLIFLEENKIALQFKRIRHKKKSDLMSIFVEKVIEEPFNKDDFKTVYLDCLFDENFSIESKIPPEDEIEFVRIKALRLEKRVGKKDRIILDVRDGENKKEIYFLLKYHKLDNPDIWEISQAVIHFKFKNKGQRGSVTTTLTLPNSDDLQDKELHKKCRKYLTDAGLMR